MHSEEIDLICKLTNAKPEQIVLHDKGCLSRGYVIDNGRIVFKFPKQSFAKYDNEVVALSIIAKENFSKTLDMSFQKVNKLWTDTKEYTYIGFYGVVGNSIADLQRKGTLINTDYVGKQIAKFLLKLHSLQIDTKVGETLNDDIKTDLEKWNTRDDRAKAFLNMHFTKQEQELLNKLMTEFMPKELIGLGQNLVFSHSDLHEGNTFIDRTGKVGIIDFDHTGYYDQARDFMRMDNDEILRVMLDEYRANETLRRKIEIRREINRPLAMIAQNLWSDEYLPKAKRLIEKYKGKL